MTTLTIDIPDNNTEEVFAQLAKLGVKVWESNLSKLDELTGEDYKKQFRHRAEAIRKSLRKHL
jgi:hypothetical protein